MSVIALDPGFSSTKVMYNGTAKLIQTAVSRPKNVGMATIGMKSAGDDVTRVSFNGNEFCVGNGAWHKGKPLTSMDYSSIVAPERMAAFYAAFGQTVTSPTLDSEICLVVGLPVPLLNDESQASLVIDSLKTLKREHVFTVDEVEHRFTVVKILKAAQPVGAYINWFLDDDLNTIKSSKGAECAIIDIGMNTLDLYVVQDGKVSETYIGGGEVGVKRLLQMIRTNGHDISELDAKLRSGHIKPPQETIDAWVSEILSSLKETMPDLKRFDVVIPVGGGVLIAGDKLRRSLASRGAKLHWSQEPVTENVRGLYKFGRKYG